MNLSEFIKKKLEELGKNRSWLVNFGDIDWQTLSNIDKGRGISKATQEKLANALGCTQGDIQACLAEQNPLKNVVVSKKSLAKLNAKKEAPAPDPEELPFTDEPEPEAEPVDMMFPVETEVEMDNRITREVAEECYKRKLKDKVGKILASTHHELTDAVRQEIGVMLLQELWGEAE